MRLRVPWGMTSALRIGRHQQANRWLAENREALAARSREMESARNSERMARYARARASRDPEWRAMIALRHRLSSMLVRKWARASQGEAWWTPKRETGKCQEICGCTLPELRRHFERQFRGGMTWENHGRGHEDWVIDHVRPVCLFDWWTLEGRREAFRWENLQPLWAWEHRAKSVYDTAQARKRAAEEPALRQRLSPDREYAPDMDGTDEQIMERLARELGMAG